MYNYYHEKQDLFTDKGQRLFIAIRDNCKKLLALSGAFTIEHAIRGQVGDTWTMMACVDRMVELDEIVELEIPGFAQRVFVGKP